MSGAVGTLLEDTKLDENSVCGVGRGYFGMPTEHGEDACGDDVLRYQWNEIPME